MRYSMPCPLGITAGGVTGTIQEAGAFMAQLVMDHNGFDSFGTHGFVLPLATCQNAFGLRSATVVARRESASKYGFPCDHIVGVHCWILNSPWISPLVEPGAPRNFSRAETSYAALDQETLKNNQRVFQSQDIVEEMHAWLRQ